MRVLQRFFFCIFTPSVGFRLYFGISNEVDAIEPHGFKCILFEKVWHMVSIGLAIRI